MALIKHAICIIRRFVDLSKTDVSQPGRTKSFDGQKPQYALLLPNEDQPAAESALVNTKTNASVIDKGQDYQVSGEKPV